MIKSLIRFKFSSGILFHNLYWIGSIIFSVVIISSVVTSTVLTIGGFDEEQLIQIPIAISAVEEANYADGVEEYVFPGIELSIVEEVLSDLEVGEQSQQDLADRVLLVIEQLQQPVPTATNPTTPNEEETTNNPPISTEPTNSLTATKTSVLFPSSTVTNMRTFTQTPTNTLVASLFPVTGTSTSTLQPGINPTFTLTPSLTSSLTPTFTRTPMFTLTPSLTSSLTPTFTRTPTFTLTPSLTSSLTPTFTRIPSSTSSLTPTFTLTPSLTSSATPTFTATSTYTVTPTWTKSVTPILTFTATNTLSPSLTPPPTLTPTPTATIAICNVSSQDKLLQYMWPPDESINVPTTIQPVIVFNQSMDASTLTYGDDNHIVICEKVSFSSNSCRSGTEVPAEVEILSVVYQNDWVNIYPLQPLEKGIRYTLFAGNQIVAHPDCTFYSKLLGGRVQSNFITMIE